MQRLERALGIVAEPERQPVEQFGVTGLFTPQAEVRRLSALGADAVGGTPEEFAQRLRLENARWGEAIRKSGVKLDD